MPEPHASLVTGLANLLETGEFSDLKVRCGDSEFAVHKNVICCQSKPLMAMCTNGMKESQESVIDLTIDTEPCVSRLISFLYRCDYDALENDSGDTSMDDGDTNKDNIDVVEALISYSDYPDNWRPSNLSGNNFATKVSMSPMTSRHLSLHVDMYILADKYDIASLGELAKKKFEEVAKQCSPFSSMCPILDTIPRIYAVTGEHNRGLRDVVVEYARLQRTKIDNRDIFTDKIETSPFTDRIESLFESVPEFAVDVSRSWLNMPYLGYCEVEDCGQIVREQKTGCKSCGQSGRNGPGDRGRVIPAW